MYFNYYSGIKFICFELIYYIINMIIISSFIMFSELISCVFISIANFNQLNYFIYK